MWKQKRAPALIDNIVQAFLMAPYFVMLEVHFLSFDVFPNKSFYRKFITAQPFYASIEILSKVCWISRLHVTSFGSMFRKIGRFSFAESELVAEAL